MRHPALVDHGLTIVLACTLKPFHLEQTIGCSIKVYVAYTFMDIWIIDCDRTILHQSRISET